MTARVERHVGRGAGGTGHSRRAKYDARRSAAAGGRGGEVSQMSARLSQRIWSISLGAVRSTPCASRTP
eukprot:3567576-Alexandrium_andersonii.AAC.1